MLTQIAKALQAANKPIPLYLQLTIEEYGTMSPHTNQENSQLRKFPQYYYLPLTEKQATMLDRALANGSKDYRKYLSPLQIALSQKILHRWPKKPMVNLTPRRDINGISRYYAELEHMLNKE